MGTSHNFIFAVSESSDKNMSFLYGAKEEVVENRKAFLGQFSLDLNRGVTLRLEHKDRLVMVDEKDAGSGMLNRQEAIVGEALITRCKEIFFFLMVADCLPVALMDPEHEVIALAHLSRETTGLGLLGKAMSKMKQDYETDPKNLLVSFGPGISKESYLLDCPRELADPRWQSYLAKRSNLYSIDLLSYNLDQLLDMGVRRANITIDGRDTATDKNLFSHYRSCQSGEVEARMAAVLAFKPY